MSWNHRIVRRTSPLGETYYALHEVHYADGDIDRPSSRSTEATDFMCDDDEGPEGIIASLERALESVKKYPVLDDPWPDEVYPDMIAKFPEDRSLLAEIEAAHAAGQQGAEVNILDARPQGFNTGYITITSKIIGVEPRVKYSFGKEPNEESMSVSLGDDPVLLGNSMQAFFRHAVAPQLINWVRQNSETLAWFWLHSGDASEKTIEGFLADLKPLEKK